MIGALSNFKTILVVITLLTVLTGCNGSSNPPGIVIGATGDFSISADVTAPLVEGTVAGTNVNISVFRENGHNKAVTLSVQGKSQTDGELINPTFFPSEVAAGVSLSTLNLFLAIDDLPIKPHLRSFIVTATDGTDTATIEIAVQVEPVDAPDIYLLAGQSNMVGFSGDGTKQAQAGGPDEPNSRIYQLNVSKNDQFNIFTNASDFSSESTNVIAPLLVTAEDPLHIPYDPSNNSGKDLSYIGMGLSFAKAALPDTTRNIVLVPAAWSGSAFCNNNNGPIGQWNALPTNNSNLGNTWLFDRAVTRANIAINESGGILRGILWHQGESDSNENCAGVYLANLERLAQELRLRINPDRRGGDLRRSTANVPFVLGTMSRGIDARDDLSVFNAEKQMVDDAHKTLPAKIAHSEVVYNDDLIPSNGYPCGNTTCIHFGPNALREMGRRYYTALKRAAEQ